MWGLHSSVQRSWGGGAVLDLRDSVTIVTTMVFSMVQIVGPTFLVLP